MKKEINKIIGYKGFCSQREMRKIHDPINRRRWCDEEEIVV